MTILQLVPVTLDFNAFWELYPRKLKKKDARTAYYKAVKLTTHEELMKGLQEYINHKPGYADWAHATTWLNGERWTDKWEEDMKGFDEL